MTEPHSIHSPLCVHPTNPRYFSDASGQVVYLTGSHTWANLQDIGLEGDPPFDYEAYLDFMTAHNYNFMRLWMFEQPERACWTDARLVFSPLPWARTGPGLAKDGLPKFNLEIWNDAYFERLRKRLNAARERGIYAAVMLFQGWCLNVTRSRNDPWPFLTFNGENNVNGVTVPYTGWDDDVNPSLHSLLNPAVLAHQEAYVRKVVDTVNDLDNVLYEIINEGGTVDWQVHITNFVHQYEATKAKQHPVGITRSGSPKMFNSHLYNSPAEWISPSQEPTEWHHPGSSFLENYKEDPPPTDGRKVVLLDTDHLWGHGINYKWVWKSFTRGYNPIFMDPWQSLYLQSTEDIAPWTFSGGISKDWRDYPDWEPARQAMGNTRRYAQRMNLADMAPRPDLVSTRYCLANPGEEYLIYLPEGGSVTVDLHQVRGAFSVEWFIPLQGRTLTRPKPYLGGDYIVLTAPYTGDVVLYLKKQPVP